MEQFKMLVHSKDVDYFKDNQSLLDENDVTILKADYVKDDFWQVEILAPNIYHIYSIGSLKGYKEAWDESGEIIKDISVKFTAMTNMAKELQRLNAELIDTLNK